MFADPRLDGWPLMSSPLPTAILCLSYVYFVKVWGPRFMENRPAFRLKGVLLVYNLFQIVFSAWLFYEFGRYGWLSGDYSYICQPVDYSYSEAGVRMMRAGYFFYISKFIDFFDTIFFVLRKKNNQITALHVIHHGLLPISIWPGVRYACGGQGTFFGFINSLVHVIMYFYYFMAALGPQFQKYLWWKKYLTTLQIVQFIIASLHCFQMTFISCDFPIAFCWWIGAHELLFLMLFINFYKKTYSRKIIKDD